jgi:hypothetical protein
VDTPDKKELAGKGNQDLEPSGRMVAGDEEVLTTQIGTAHHGIHMNT